MFSLVCACERLFVHSHATFATLSNERSEENWMWNIWQSVSFSAVQYRTLDSKIWFWNIEKNFREEANSHSGDSFGPDSNKMRELAGRSNRLMDLMSKRMNEMRWYDNNRAGAYSCGTIVKSKGKWTYIDLLLKQKCLCLLLFALLLLFSPLSLSLFVFVFLFPCFGYLLCVAFSFHRQAGGQTGDRFEHVPNAFQRPWIQSKIHSPKLHANKWTNTQHKNGPPDTIFYFTLLCSLCEPVKTSLSLSSSLCFDCRTFARLFTGINETGWERTQMRWQRTRSLSLKNLGSLFATVSIRSCPNGLLRVFSKSWWYTTMPAMMMTGKLVFILIVLFTCFRTWFRMVRCHRNAVVFLFFFFFFVFFLPVLVCNLIARLFSIIGDKKEWT